MTLVAIAIFCIINLPFALFNFSFTIFLLSKIYYIIPATATSLILSFKINKNKILGALLTLLFTLFTTFIAILIFVKETENNEKVVWNSPNDYFTTDFFVGEHGHILLNAKINDITGLFFFDTGAGQTSVNEKYLTDEKMKLHPFSMCDVRGNTQTKNLFKVRLFELGSFGIERLQAYPTDSAAWTDPKGIHYNQDSILGIIGNNIISKFIWDFDLVNHRVTISNNKKYCKTIPNSLAINLVQVNKHKEIAVQINGTDKILTLDFGCRDPIVISGSIPNKQGESGGTSNQSKGFLNHLDTTDRSAINFDFVDVKLGSYEFKQIKCNENEKVDLLGIPFVWAFKRVIIDFSNNNIYFISKNDSLVDFSVNMFNEESLFLRTNGIMTLFSSHKGTVLLVNSKDSVPLSYTIYGRSVFYKSNNKLDSIFVYDSLLLPDGRIQMGPYILKPDRYNKKSY
ncbi:MAG: hypothetical protein K9H26_18585 [Prolixibacteraceae bacterium]|nr:hypothetical protein [Prolixibacteraceae bacterium]